MTELEALIRSIPDSYDGLFRGVREKLGSDPIKKMLKKYEPNINKQKFCRNFLTNDFV